MSTNNEQSDMEGSSKLRMKPAIRRIFCCSVTAASGFIAAYALVAYAIALIYEIVWVVEARGSLPVPAAMLMLCYVVVITATVALVHGLISKNNKCLLAWLIAVVLVLIPECALVFYMAISYWGLQGVYGGAELACYVARLPAVVIGVVLVQSAYALREARRDQQLLSTDGAGRGRGAGVEQGVVHFTRPVKFPAPAEIVIGDRKGFGGPAVPASGSEFDASHYVPDAANAFTNDGFLNDSGKPGSMPDLRRHIAARQSINLGYPPMMLSQPPPAYWQHLAERHYAASLRGFPKAYPTPQAFGTWVGPRSGPYDNPYKRRHSIVGAFHTEEYLNKDYGEIYPEDRLDCKSEMAYPHYRSYPYYERYNHDYEPRYGYPDYKREDAAYGVNLLRHEPYHFSSPRERLYYTPGLRNSHTSVGNESDDFTKYKDVAL